MAQANYTPIQLYYSTTNGNVPSNANLLPGELGFNIHSSDFSLYAENSAGTVTRLMNNPSGLKYPTTDGTANQVIATNASGVLSFATVQATLVSGTNIKTVNSNSLVGSGDVVIGAVGSVAVFTASDTWTCPAGVTRAKFTVTGGGGSGAASANAQPGGGGGATAIKWATVVPGTVYTVTIGAGGAAVATSNNGNAGGNSTVTGSGFTTLTGGGGGGGQGGGAGTGGTATNGDLNLRGGDSVGNLVTGVVAGALGGVSIWGGAAQPNAAGACYGAGGGGTYGAANSMAGYAGVIVIEY